MLEKSSRQLTKNPLQDKPSPPKVTCFVCKQAVDSSRVVKLYHPKERDVWVCEQHLKR
jgi:hypothetical protein